MEYFLILLVNLVYLHCIWHGVVNDDAAELKVRPYNVKQEKIFNILLHLAVSELIYAVFGSLTAAILFSIHPLAIQIPAWKAGRHYGLNAGIFLSALAFFPFSAPLLLLSEFSIGTTLFLPLAFLFTKHWYVALIFLPIAGLSYKKIKTNISNKKSGGGIFSVPLPDDFTPQNFKWKNLIIVVKTFGYYSLACLLPIKNGFYNSFLVTIGASEKDNRYWYSFNRHFWGGIFAFIFMFVIWWFNKFNFIGMGILIFGLSLIPFLNFITVQQFTAPRYAYLPLIGFQVALAGCLTHLPLPLRCFIVGALFLFYLDRTLRVMRHYAKDNISMMELDSQVFPENPRLWYYRYEHMLHKGNPVMAWAEATYGLKHLPEDCQLWFGLACASFELGDYNAASEFLKTSEKFMLLADRKSMQSLIAEFRARIKVELVKKFSPPRRTSWKL